MQRISPVALSSMTPSYLFEYKDTCKRPLEIIARLIQSYTETVWTVEKDCYEAPSSYFGNLVDELPHGFGVNFTPITGDLFERIELGWFEAGNLISGQKVQVEFGEVSVEEGLFSGESLSQGSQVLVREGREVCSDVAVKGERFEFVIKGEGLRSIYERSFNEDFFANF